MEPTTFQKYLENLSKVNRIMSYRNNEEKIITKKEKSTSKLCREVYMQKLT